MGVDIYLRWNLITDEEIEAQYCGFDTGVGKIGYLREAYHGEPYPSKILMPESYESSMSPCKIPAATLRERLPETIKAAIKREQDLYHTEGVDENYPSVKSYTDFVELAEKLEAEGQEPVIVNSY
jgi:hypothetical protein|tara:strand:+ start:1948 stop:2322 length:375 start_codon:yes stop_codon:yes gene_type:complete